MMLRPETWVAMWTVQHHLGTRPRAALPENLEMEPPISVDEDVLFARREHARARASREGGRILDPERLTPE